jgi:hypothetical protein
LPGPGIKEDRAKRPAFRCHQVERFGYATSVTASSNWEL